MTLECLALPYDPHRPSIKAPTASFKIWHPFPKFETARAFVSFLWTFELQIPPVDHPFRTETPLFVQKVTTDVLHHEGLFYIEKMRRTSGDQVCLPQVRYEPYNTFVATAVLGDTTEPAVSIAAVRYASSVSEIEKSCSWRLD